MESERGVGDLPPVAELAAPLTGSRSWDDLWRENAELRSESVARIRELEAEVEDARTLRDIATRIASDRAARICAAEATIARVEGEREDARHEAETYRTAIHDRRQHPEVELDVFGNHRFPWERAAESGGACASPRSPHSPIPCRCEACIGPAAAAAERHRRTPESVDFDTSPRGRLKAP